MKQSLALAGCAVFALTGPPALGDAYREFIVVNGTQYELVRPAGYGPGRKDRIVEVNGKMYACTLRLCSDVIRYVLRRQKQLDASSYIMRGHEQARMRDTIREQRGGN